MFSWVSIVDSGGLEGGLVRFDDGLAGVDGGLDVFMGFEGDLTGDSRLCTFYRRINHDVNVVFRAFSSLQLDGMMKQWACSPAAYTTNPLHHQLIHTQ